MDLLLSAAITHASDSPLFTKNGRSHQVIRHNTIREGLTRNEPFRKLSGVYRRHLVAAEQTLHEIRVEAFLVGLEHATARHSLRLRRTPVQIFHPD